MSLRNGFYAVTLALLLAAGCSTSQNTGTSEENANNAAAMDANTQEAPQMATDEQTPPPPAQQQAPSRPAAPAPAAPRPAATPPPAAPQPTTPQPATPAPSAPATTTQAPPQPAIPMIDLPEGTVLNLELRTDLSSGKSQVGDEFKARVLDPVTMGGQVLIPVKSKVFGTVTEAASAKKMSGQAHLTLSFDKLVLPDGSTYAMTASLTQDGVKVGKRTGAIVGGSAAGGALLGKIIGKNTKGAVKGALIGAAIGTGIAAAQKGQDLELPSGSEMAIVLEAPLSLPAPK